MHYGKKKEKSRESIRHDKIYTNAMIEGVCRRWGYIENKRYQNGLVKVIVTYKEQNNLICTFLRFTNIYFWITTFFQLFNITSPSSICKFPSCSSHKLIFFSSLVFTFHLQFTLPCYFIQNNFEAKISTHLVIRKFESNCMHIIYCTYIRTSTLGTSEKSLVQLLTRGELKV